MTSVLLYTATSFQLIVISTSFQSQSTLFWENICNLVQIGANAMFNNFVLCKYFFLHWKKYRFLFVYTVNYSS